MVGFHRELNRETAASWAEFRSHRERVTRLILGLAPPAAPPAEPTRPTVATLPTLAILGAGNCNDLALDELAGRYGRIHLFDIDGPALLKARDRQPPEIAARLVLHAPVDLGGALADLGKLRRREASPAELGALLSAGTREVVERVPERFDAVASTCIISQLVHGCQRLLGDEHPQIQPIACAVVVAHLRIVAQLARPGGKGLIVTDTVSSDTYPLEELWSARAPWALVEELQATGNHLSGTSPKFLRRILNTDPVIAPLVTSSTVREEPWLWTLSEEETYLVYALEMARRV